MKVSSLKATAFFAVAALVATAEIASAAALATADDAKCRATVAKNATKLAVTISKAFDGCIKAGVKAGAGPTCGTTAGADLKGKVTGAKTKVTDGIANSCDDTAQAIPLAEHQLCGTPVGGAPIATFAAVGTCLNSLVDANVERLRNAILNPNYAGALADTTKAQGKCINAIAKNATKLLSTIQKERSKVQNTSDKALGDSGYVNTGALAKITAAETKLSDGITKACQPVEDDLSGSGWANVRSCDDDLAGVIECVTNKVTAVAEGVTASSYDQPGSCPAAVEVKIHHGGQGGADLGATELDVGFTGFGHNADVIDDFVGAVNISCGAAPDDCTTCSATASCAEGNCRCSNDISILCTQPFGEDGVGVEECGANDCRLFFGPPLPLSASGTPTCVVNEISSELISTANIATGESDTQIDNTAIVHLGISQAKPCPTCVSGACVGGDNAGDPCTVDGTSPFGDVSYDCAPDPLGNIGSLQIGLNLTDDAVSMPFALQCDPPLGAEDCACSVCNGDLTVPCNSDAECVGFGGTCLEDGLHGGETRVPNKCNDGTCDVLAGEEGVCNGTDAVGPVGTGPTDSYCDGFLKGNGEGIVTCSTNGDCAVGVVGVAAGNCTQERDRPCFLDPIDADGTAGSEGAVLVGNFCSPPTISAAVNGAAGTPGPARLALDFEFVGHCADGAIWGPGGANCQ